MEEIKYVGFNLNKTQRQIINEKEVHLPVFRIDIDDLRFNPFSTRIFDQVLSYEEFLKMSEQELKSSKKVQKFIFDKLKETHSDIENIKLKKSIEKNGLMHPLIAIKGNILLAGNNRLSLLKSIKAENEIQYVEVAYYNKDLTKDEIVQNELILQNELEIKRDYETMSKVLRIYELKNEGKYDDEKISLMVGLPVKENYEIVKLYYEFLAYHKKIQRIDLYRHFKVYSSLAELRKINKYKYKDKNVYKIKNIFFDLILYSIISTLKIRDLIFIILRNKNKDKRKEKINEIEEYVKNKISDYKHRINLFIDENGLDKVNDFLAKEENKNELKQISEDIFNRIKDIINNQTKKIEKEIAHIVFDLL